MHKDLDTIIKHIRAGERMGLLEFPDIISDITIQRIIEDISREALGLYRNTVRDFLPETVTRPLVEPNESWGKLQAIDKKMIRLPIYKKLRPWLIEKIKPSMFTCDVSALLRYNGSEFISAAYRAVLGRAAEQTAIVSGTLQIITGDVSKIQFIDLLFHSPEHVDKNIGVKGLRFKMVINRLKRGILRIPVLGYLLRFFKEIILLPRRIRNISRRIALLEYSLEEANKKLAQIEITIEKNSFRGKK